MTSHSSSAEKPPLFRGLLIVLAVVFAAGAFYLFRPGRQEAAPTLVDDSEPAAAEASSHTKAGQAGPVAEVKPVAPRGALPAAAGRSHPQVPASPEAVKLVGSLQSPAGPDGLLTVELAGTWRTNLALLVQQGTAALPAIREFLEQNQDVDFGEGKLYLGYSSLRLAMLDAMAHIGGPDALSALQATLPNLADPMEIAVVARSLDQLDPGMHRQSVVEAAQQALLKAADNKNSGKDVAPLFEVLTAYGDASLASELARNSRQWNYYAVYSLAQLPDGAGIPTLAQIVNDETGYGSSARVPALEMLAQAATRSEVARATLLDQASQGKLTAYNWATLEAPLAGDLVGFQNAVYDTSLQQQRSTDVKRSHIASGNQNFYSAPPVGGLTPDQVQQQTALIDELLKVTTDQTGIQSLQRAKANLQKRVLRASGAAATQR